ncbi:hypothetical protein ACFLYF_05385 [Chloroflexota bacterium]
MPVNSEIGEMQIALSAYRNNKKLAGQLIDFGTSSEGTAVFEKHGYIVDSEEARKYWH